MTKALYYRVLSFTNETLYAEEYGAQAPSQPYFVWCNAPQLKDDPTQFELTTGVIDELYSYAYFKTYQEETDGEKSTAAGGLHANTGADTSAQPDSGADEVHAKSARAAKGDARPVLKADG